MWNSEGTSYKRLHVILRMVERMQSAWVEASKGKLRISVVDLSGRIAWRETEREKRDTRTSLVPGAGIFAVSTRCMFSRNDM